MNEEINSSVNPVGHTPPFTGDFQTMLHCLKEATARVRAKDFYSESLYTHAAQAMGEAAVLAPLEADGPQPVGADAYPDTVEGVCDLLEARIQEFENRPVGSPQPVGSGGIPWMTLILLLLQSIGKPQA